MNESCYGGNHIAACCPVKVGARCSVWLIKDGNRVSKIQDSAEVQIRANSFTEGLGMSDSGCTAWVNDMTNSPKINGNLEICTSPTGVFIGGDPDGLRSLAKLLIWLASVDQESLTAQPDGERCHVHLHARDADAFNSLTPLSLETEVCRLDAKGTGDLPSAEKYCKLRKAKMKEAKKSGKGRSLFGTICGWIGLRKSP